MIQNWEPASSVTKWGGPRTKFGRPFGSTVLFGRRPPPKKTVLPTSCGVSSMARLWPQTFALLLHSVCGAETQETQLKKTQLGANRIRVGRAAGKRRGRSNFRSPLAETARYVRRVTRCLVDFHPAWWHPSRGRMRLAATGGEASMTPKTTRCLLTPSAPHGAGPSSVLIELATLASRG